MVKTEKLGVYPILGLNLSTVKAKLGDQKEKESETGINLGIGLSIGSGMPFVEAKYETIAEGQFFIGGGFRFPIN